MAADENGTHYDMLEEENKNLRAYADNLDSENDNQAIEIEELKKENKKLKKENKKLKEERDLYKARNEELNENCFWLARENDKLKIHIEAKDKAYMDLLADYNYLKARIKKTERAFIKYKEKLEKLEVDLDMVVMNR